MSGEAALRLLGAGLGFGLIAIAGEVAYRLLEISAEVTRGVEHVIDGMFSALLPLILTFPQIAFLMLS